MTEKALTDLMFQLQRSAILMHRGGHKRPHGPMGGVAGPMGPMMGGHGGPMRPDGPAPARGEMPSMRGQGLLLGFLLEEDDVPLKDLVEKMDIRPSSLSELVRKLQRAGLVETQEDAQDRRSVRVRLTGEGRSRAQETVSAREEKLSALFAGLTEEEQQTLLALLTKLNDSLLEKQEDGEDPRFASCPQGCVQGHDRGHGFGPRREHGHGPWGPGGPRERMRGFWPREEGPEEIIELEV